MKVVWSPESVTEATLTAEPDGEVTLTSPAVKVAGSIGSSKVTVKPATGPATVCPASEQAATRGPNTSMPVATRMPSSEKAPAL
ncbi:MAG: hypothetical protein BWY91_02945 [bacterium ADurb.BinA028]|nr:MAG: hypothetical protein BWY91_02945 [bacterium ADurb.BinA028]